MRKISTIAELEQMLTYARPHGSQGEADFVERYLTPLPGMTWDRYGNGVVAIGNAPVLWSAHTDTVHSTDARQAVTRQGHILRLTKKTKGTCLGADDGAGVWLLMEMIRASVPGLYVFHAGEECGGLGSAWIVKNRAELVHGYKFAIAFDRKGTESIITHQGSRTCSDAFALSLSLSLGGGYHCDDTGTFTDTANYTGLIGECTNVSVGYENNHRPNETLDLLHVRDLHEHLIAFDCTGLVHSRQAGDSDVWEDAAAYHDEHYSSRLYETRHYDESLVQMVYDHPESAARLIEQLGGNAGDMLEQISGDGHSLPVEYGWERDTR